MDDPLSSSVTKRSTFALAALGLKSDGIFDWLIMYPVNGIRTIFVRCKVVKFHKFAKWARNHNKKPSFVFHAIYVAQ